MNNTITITIQTGNDTAQTDSDIARILKELSLRIGRDGLDHVTKVMDDNGNAVGTVVGTVGKGGTV